MQFFGSAEGQDLIEYSLLRASLCMAAAALFIRSGGSLAGIWTRANSDLANANAEAS